MDGMTTSASAIAHARRRIVSSSIRVRCEVRRVVSSMAAEPSASNPHVKPFHTSLAWKKTPLARRSPEHKRTGVVMLGRCFYEDRGLPPRRTISRPSR